MPWARFSRRTVDQCNACWFSSSRRGEISSSEGAGRVTSSTTMATLSPGFTNSASGLELMGFFSARRISSLPPATHGLSFGLIVPRKLRVGIRAHISVFPYGNHTFTISIPSTPEGNLTKDRSFKHIEGKTASSDVLVKVNNWRTLY